MGTSKTVSDGALGSTRPDYLARADILAQHIMETALTSDHNHRLSDESVSKINSSGVCRVCQPAEFGGAELSWEVLCEIAICLGAADASHAWVVTKFAENNFLLAQFPEAAQQDVWGQRGDQLISSSFSPNGTVSISKGGWILSGRFDSCSGVRHSSWTIVGAILPTGKDGVPVHSFLLVPAADIKILDQEEPIGLSGTGSVPFELKDAFVPDHRVLDGLSAARGESPGAKRHSIPLYKMPNLGFAQTAHASVAVGAAKGAVSRFTELLGTQKSKGRPLGESQVLQIRLAEASAEAEAGRLMVLATARENMARLNAGHRLMLGDLARSRRNSAYAAKLSMQAAQRLFEGIASAGFPIDPHLQRAFLDIAAIEAQVALNWDANATIYGRYIAGLDLEGLL